MKTLSIIAIAGIATAASASGIVANGNFTHSASNQTGQTATGTYVFSFGDTEHWGLLGDPQNIIQSLDLNALLGGAAGADAFVTGLGWDVTVTAPTPSWLSEAGYGFSGQVNLAPGTGDDFSGGPTAYSSGGIIDISDAVGFDILAAGGNLDIEFFDGFDDFAGAPDGITSGSLTLVVSYKVPAPAGLAVLGLGGLAAARRRR